MSVQGEKTDAISDGIALEKEPKDREPETGFTHFNESGDAWMVDIHDKSDSYRIAIATGRIQVNQSVYDAIGNHTAKKGDVLGVARIAGIMGAKKNAELIPLCHNISLTKCEVDFNLDDKTRTVEAKCTAACVGKTGVEMEALTGVSIALLTIYDMCKAMDRGMIISEIRLLEKEGGKSGHFIAAGGSPYEKK